MNIPVSAFVAICVGLITITWMIAQATYVSKVAQTHAQQVTHDAAIEALRGAGAHRDVLIGNLGGELSNIQKVLDELRGDIKEMRRELQSRHDDGR